MTIDILAFQAEKIETAEKQHQLTSEPLRHPEHIAHAACNLYHGCIRPADPLSWDFLLQRASIEIDSEGETK